MSNVNHATEEEEDDTPRRCIFNDEDMKHFMESSTKRELLTFVEAMGKACATTSGSSSGSEEIEGADAAAFDPANPLVGLTPSIACLYGSMQEMVRWVDDFPPITDHDKVRFGNPSFRLWHQRLLDRSEAIITVLLQARDTMDDATTITKLEKACELGKQAAAGSLHPSGADTSIRQVSCYLHDSFGHATRLDYGTGHESSFFVFLLILSKVKCFGPNTPSLQTLRAISLSVVSQYLQVTRRLQTEYRLEPAGSHGVWGLDDYHCLPFFLGACQLQSKSIPSELSDPKCQNDEYILKEYGDAYLYLGCIRYIRQLKQGVPFFESSPMLYDISQTLPSWDKIARGLLRLYQGEVLDKRQVVQHFVFSKWFPCTWTPSKSADALVAPSETFRMPAGAAAESNTTATTTTESTRAPWATTRGGGGGSSRGAIDSTGVPAPTRAPWAAAVDHNSITGGADFIATRAPWATTKDSNDNSNLPTG